MARSGRPKAELVLSDVERETLLRWTRRAKTSQALALRARIVLACAEGVTNTLLEARFNDLPDDFFKVPTKDLKVFDNRKKKDGK